MNLYTECKAIVELDLDPIKVKSMHKESGAGWTLEQANAVATEYRRFLYLMKMYPNEAVAPLMDVDTFWHYHILDTMKYAQDCQAVFGYFLHHFPYVGLRGQDDLAAHARMGERMRDLYEETFGEKYRLEPSKQETVAFSSAPGGPSFSALEQVGARRKLRTAFSAAPGIAFSSASGQSAGHKAGQHASRDGLHPAFLSSQVTAFSCASGKTAGQFSMATEERTMDAFYSTRPRL